MQYMAMFTMLIDHIGIVFYPDNPVWRIIGRIAFPIYAYCIAVGFDRTQNRPRYIKRLAIIGAVSQIPYMAALDALQFNVIFTFLASIGVLFLMDKMYRSPAKAAVFLVAAALMYFLPFSYGGYALVLIWFYRSLPNRPHLMVMAHVLLNLVEWYRTGTWLQMVSILPTFLIAYAPQLARQRNAPRWLWWSFYPAHLLVLGIIRVVIEWR